MAGIAIAAKIQEVYSFIAKNYIPGDQIYLFGFSRGAYIARKVADIIDALGILKKKHTYSLFEHLSNLLDPAAINATNRKPQGQSAEVKFIGVWNTIGDIPNVGMEKLRDVLELDTRVRSCVKLARQALAYHEGRAEYQYVPFELSEAEDTLERASGGANEGMSKKQDPHRLVQVWLPGVHGDVGGEYKDNPISDISLLRMAAHIGQGELEDAGVELDEVSLGKILLCDDLKLRVYSESIRRLGRDIFQETMSRQSTYSHLSMLTLLEHAQHDQTTLWDKQTLVDVCRTRTNALNRTEQKLWPSCGA
ncbi:hypothetical protein FRC07_011827, partial [Ceratobasidium sp. 392]